MCYGSSHHTSPRPAVSQTNAPLNRRKPTAKKNKTWDGDGIVSTRDGYVYLQDISGREMGRAMHSSNLKTGTVISIGGKEVEIDTEMTRKEYLAGRKFLGNKEDLGWLSTC